MSVVQYMSTCIARGRDPITITAVTQLDRWSIAVWFACTVPASGYLQSKSSENLYHAGSTMQRKVALSFCHYHGHDSQGNCKLFSVFVSRLTILSQQRSCQNLSLRKETFQLACEVTDNFFLENAHEISATSQAVKGLAGVVGSSLSTESCSFSPLVGSHYPGAVTSRIMLPRTLDLN